MRLAKNSFTREVTGTEMMMLTGDTETNDILALEQEIDAAIEGKEIQNAMGEIISKRHVRVLSMRFGLGGYEPHTLAEVAEALEVTKERIRQIEIKALRLLRSRLGEDRENWLEYLSNSE